MVVEGSFDRVESGVSDRRTTVPVKKSSGNSSFIIWVLVTNIVVFAATLGVTYVVTKDHFDGKSASVEVAPAAPAAAPPSTPCVAAEPQAPRDISTTATGTRSSRVKIVPWATYKTMTHVNTHFHLGAEHKSDGEYDIAGTASSISSATPGYKCDTSTFPSNQMAAYDFQYCKEVEVGETYELHWVHSNNGVSLGGGLGGAFARGQNPTVSVAGQVFVVVNDPSEAIPDLVDKFQEFQGFSVRSYMGSTTGGSYNNEICSPYTVSWHVDPTCRLVDAASFDQMCKILKENDAEADIHPHSSRAIVDPKFVVPNSQVS